MCKRMIAVLHMTTIQHEDKTAIAASNNEI